MYFKLNNSCFIKNGENGSVLYNLAKNDLVELDSDETKLLLLADSGVKLTGNEEKFGLLKALEEMGYGFFSEHNYFVDKLRPYNKFSLTRPDLFPLNPTTAYLQLTNKCRLGADFCSKRFCSPCMCDENEISMKLDEWKNVVDSLIEFGTKVFVLTGGNILMYSELQGLADYIRKSGANVSILINEIDDRIYQLDKSMQIICNQCNFEYSDEQLSELIDYFPNLTVMSTYDPKIEKDKLIKITSEYKIEKENFAKPDIEKYYLRKDRDLCLTGKIFITSSGNIVPCFTMKNKIIGNVLHENIKKLIKSLAERHWNMHSENYKKCADCKWFYACHSCQAFDAEKNCGIN